MAQEKAVVGHRRPRHDAGPDAQLFEKIELTGERTLEMTYRKDKVNAGQVLAALADGLGIVDVSTREADLEDVFLSLTRGASQDGRVSMTTDVLVIGSGAAGLTAALTLAREHKVTVLAKGALGGQPAWAQGGIAAVLEPATRSRAIRRHDGRRRRAQRARDGRVRRRARARGDRPAGRARRAVRRPKAMRCT